MEIVLDIFGTPLGLKPRSRLRMALAVGVKLNPYTTTFLGYVHVSGNHTTPRNRAIGKSKLVICQFYNMSIDVYFTRFRLPSLPMKVTSP